MTSSTRRWNGSTGTTTAGCTASSATSHPPSSKPPTTLNLRHSNRSRHQHEAGNEPETVHSLVQIQVDTLHADTIAGEGTDTLRVQVRDDGRGGATLAGGTGLLGLKDCVEALGGRLILHSPTDASTTLRLELPLTEAEHAGRGLR